MNNIAMTQTDYKAAYDRQCARIKELEKSLSEQIEHTGRAYMELEEVHEHYKKFLDDLREKLIDDTVG